MSLDADELAHGARLLPDAPGRANRAARARLRRCSETTLHLPLLRRRLRRDHRARRRADHRRARRPGPPGQLRPPVQQGQHAAPDRHRGGARCRRGCCSRCSAPQRGARAAAASAGTRRSTWPPSASPTSSREHGPDAVGFYLSGQLLTEDYYVFNKLAKGLIGTNNVDTNSRLCMSSAVAGYKATLGADAPPACYDDLRPRRQRCSSPARNTACAHPILFRRIEDAQARQPGAEDRSSSTRAAPRPPRPPTCTCRSCPAPTSRCSTACCT